MNKGNTVVEQVTKKGEIVLDPGLILSKKEINKKILDIFPNAYLKDGRVFGTYLGKEYCFFSKNISYLGNPHPLFKKRIQISKDFLTLFAENKKNNIETLLVGVYYYDNNFIFCDFDVSNYVNNKAHNSSAHVLVNDILRAVENGIFKKKDTRKNIITVFDEEKIEAFLRNKFSDEENGKLQIVKIFEDFFDSIDKVWYGVSSYKKMIDANFSNKFQPEWPGFFLEFKMHKYIIEKNLSDIIKYSQNKKKNDIDLDLYFENLECYADLKAHSISSGAIQGNDYETVMEILNNFKIYYVVCNHETVKDKDLNYVVTEYWNSILNKDNKRSYGTRMKNKVILKNYNILELNNYNKRYIDIYNQGKNSDGKPRNPKIMIKTKNIENFIIHSTEF